jgi:hypothetical protein
MGLVVVFQHQALLGRRLARQFECQDLLQRAPHAAQHTAIRRLSSAVATGRSAIVSVSLSISSMV